uniref:Uncharacterized protein n=1 Tax=Pyrodinium bahamense TaxID=73915 RepID=A0A7S0ABZ8_9DINO|mmetsp:Transcript_30500/g.84148  ORF Transcript_30500/g.84148 Transcript_30500/m.84148 type:complete len:116 (+) Transcript_30500:114-461(+)
MGCLSSSAAGGADSPAGKRYAAEAQFGKGRPGEASGSTAPGGDEPVLAPAATEEVPPCLRRGADEAVPIERAGLWRDADGDEAHEFWEEDRRSGDLRPVADSALRRVEAAKAGRR